MKLKNIYILFVVIFMFSSCDIVDNDAKPDENIYKIIGNSNFEKTFFANRLIQTNDGGYLILGSNYDDAATYVWLTPYITKLDKYGLTEWETELASPYVNPAGIWENNGTYFIACMDDITLGTHILSVNASNGSTELVKTIDELIYPLALVKTPDGGVAIEGYERNSRNTTLTKLDASQQIEWTNSYPLIENSEELVIGHISKRGKQYPFFVGYTGESSVQNYFINGFYRYSFSMIFADASGSYTGVMNGFRYSGAVSSAYPISGDTYFLSTFLNGNNYFLSNQTLSTTATASIEALDGSLVPKLEEDATVKVQKFTIDGLDRIVYVANSKSNQILLYIYDATTGEFILSKEISDYYPIEINDIIQTQDNGIAIIGQTVVTGRFPRIFFLKLTNEKLSLESEE